MDPTPFDNVMMLYQHKFFYRAALGSTGYMFCNFIDLEFLSVHENAEKKLGQ